MPTANHPWKRFPSVTPKEIRCPKCNGRFIKDLTDDPIHCINCGYYNVPITPLTEGKDEDTKPLVLLPGNSGRMNVDPNDWEE